MTPLWIRNVISLCNAQGGRITSEEIANVAAVAKRFALGSSLVSQLKRHNDVLVEVIAEEIPAGQHRRSGKIKVYRVTRKSES